MTFEEVRQAAIECLSKALRGGEVPVHVVQAAVSILLMEPPRK